MANSTAARSQISRTPGTPDDSLAEILPRTGRRPQPFALAGGGQEFLDHRHFHQGDDLRAVNWRAYMRLDKMFLKMFQVEPRVPVRMLVDISESMAAGSAEKFDYARKLAGALCYVGLVRLDTIEVLPFAEKLHEGKTCGGGRHRFTPLARFLEGLRPGGTTTFPQGGSRVPQRLSAARPGHRNFRLPRRRPAATTPFSISPTMATN